MKSYVTTRLFYDEMAPAYAALTALREGFPSPLEAREALERALAAFEPFRKAADAFARPNITLDGVTCGAVPDGDPFGGGAGYSDIYTGGDYVVSDIDGLQDAAARARAGDVIYLTPDAVIDLSDNGYTDGYVLRLAGGVTLAGSRGLDGSPGPLILTDKPDIRPLILAEGDGVRLTGLVIRGPDGKSHERMHTSCYNADRTEFDHKRYYLVPISDGIHTEHNNLTVDNCELAGFAHGAICLRGGRGHRIHHCYIHHNQLKGLGYGVVHGYSSVYSKIDHNVFQYNRHSIAATGVPDSGYEACHNLELGDAIGHNFDVHGGCDRKDGTDIAMRSVSLHHNTFMEQREHPYYLRGFPEERQDIYNNWFYRPLAAYRPKALFGERVYVRDNAFGRDEPVLERG